MPRAVCVLVAICLLAGSGFLGFVASSPAIAKQKPTVAAKEKTSGAFKKKQKSVAARAKQPSLAAKSRKPVASAKEEPRLTAQPRTPVDKQDCIAAAQAFYAQAQSLAGRTKQTVPQEFQRVVSQLDEFCGEEEFEKARVSIDWMNLCLQNFTADNKVEFCSRKEEYFCAVDPQSDACVTSEAHANN
jgi:hypothetical protein